MLLFVQKQYFNDLLRYMAFLSGCIVFGSLLLMPGSAFACSVCFNAGGDASVSAYLVTAAFLSLLPLTMVMLVVRWIRRQE